MFEAGAATLRSWSAPSRFGARRPPPQHDEQFAATRPGSTASGTRTSSRWATPRTRALLETADPPLLLYAQGRVELLQAASIAVVGSRNPTAQGSDNARAFAEHLSQPG